jgi:hypothetical protein
LAYFLRTFAALALLAIVSTGQDTRTLSDEADLAKGRGETRIELPPILITPTPDYDFATLAKTFSFVVSSPISSVVIEEPGARLATWIKFRKQETIKVESPIDDDRHLLAEIPSSLLPVRQNEFLIFLSGGTRVVHGVTFHQSSDLHGLTFQLHSNYLLILHFVDDGKRAFLGAMDDGVFVIDPDGSLAPVTSGHALVRDDVKSKYAGSLVNVKDTISAMEN